ncbi:hypothetical protein FB45DRAFT_863929 [Roridomyces roridus]|uniref:Uncharacterized protein n=1 Tax=Roridomyces roridus TaxID=1738132 RepID=A0AAD7FVB8_9AGAR|nr:hypothetical protein FB45DRAFT_863929 [Roridomyces roridus]
MHPHPASLVQPFFVLAPSGHHRFSRCVAPPPPPPTLLLLVPVPVLVVLALLAVLKWLPPRRTAPPACNAHANASANATTRSTPSRRSGSATSAGCCSCGYWDCGDSRQRIKVEAATRAKAGCEWARTPRYVHHTRAYKCVRKRAGHTPVSSSPSLVLGLVEWEWDLEVECEYACCTWAPLVLKVPARQRTALSSSPFPGLPPPLSLFLEVDVVEDASAAAVLVLWLNAPDSGAMREPPAQPRRDVPAPQSARDRAAASTARRKSAAPSAYAGGQWHAAAVCVGGLPGGRRSSYSKLSVLWPLSWRMRRSTDRDLERSRWAGDWRNSGSLDAGIAGTVGEVGAGVGGALGVVVGAGQRPWSIWIQGRRWQRRRWKGAGGDGGRALCAVPRLLRALRGGHPSANPAPARNQIVSDAT